MYRELALGSAPVCRPVCVASGKAQLAGGAAHPVPGLLLGMGSQLRHGEENRKSGAGRGSSVFLERPAAGLYEPDDSERLAIRRERASVGHLQLRGISAA